MAYACWSDGDKVGGAVGTSGHIYAYPRPQYITHINSLYVRNVYSPNDNGVEAGLAATGSTGVPPNQDPWFFIVTMTNHHYFENDFNYSHLFPVGQRREVTIRNTTGTGNNWEFYFNGVLETTRNMGSYLVSGYSNAGEERSLKLDTPSASITYMKLMAWEGGSPAWQYWNYGLNEGKDDYWVWYLDHVGDVNHWIYTNPE